MSSGFEVISVSQLNFYVKSKLDGDPVLQNIFLRGEISNFTNHYRSGHLYMSLKDENAVVRAVMFRGNAQHLKFLPENGMKVVAFGRATIYDRDGQFQFYIEDMQPDGVGALHIAFEQLKTKLAGEGLFDEERKIPLVPYPETVGVVTSPTGAVIQDITNVLSRRWPIAKIHLYPVKVQGDEAPKEICEGIKALDEAGNCDVIIVARGGGSIEDLWAFNDETVARTIADCQTPIVSAVGHETDYTIADFVADMRAPTPSAAAEVVSPEINDVMSQVASMKDEMQKCVQYFINNCEMRLVNAQGSQVLSNPESVLSAYVENLDGLKQDLQDFYKDGLEQRSSKLSQMSAILDSLSPLKVLSRGYVIAEKNKKIIESVKNIKENDTITLNFNDGNAECEVKKTSERPVTSDEN